ncbi:hypothetical protein FQR65_LT05016 [Abscondita terminalis]|nr:hypothetical protein FQR65_LT05016 [Abscondita terminalis]
MCRLVIALLALAVIGAQCVPQFRPAPAPAPRQSFPPTAPVANNIAPQFIQPRQQPQQQLLRRPIGFETESEDYENYQNQNANYQFSSNIEDHINDLTNQREEVREGAAVKGKYSYSDGYFKITVSYIADENGYRVTGMDAVPLAGPQVDLKGTASVSSTAHGAQLRYRVASVPVPETSDKIGNRHAQQFPSHTK